jgi:polar amino acid transport system substrate-binding protein
MDDDRIERSLRRGPPADPHFEPSGRWLEAAEQALEGRPDSARGVPFTAIVGLAAAASIVAVALIAGQLIQVREQGVGGLVAEVERRGILRVAIDGGPPQVFSSGLGYDGFDLDVASEVADRLGVRLDIVVVPRAQILAADARGVWDVAISSTPAALSMDAAARSTEPYARVAGAVAVRPDDQAQDIEDLASSDVCVVRGSAAEAWLGDNLIPDHGDEVQALPSLVSAQVQTTLAECLVGLRDGTWRAVVVDRRADLLGAAGARVLGGEPPFVLRLVAIVDGREQGAASLVTRLNRLFEEMAAEGVIADLSRRRFAGDDATP